MIHRTTARVLLAFFVLSGTACRTTPNGDGAIGTQVFLDSFDEETWSVVEEFNRRFYYAGGRYFVDVTGASTWAYAPYARGSFAGELSVPYGVSVEATVLLDSPRQEASAAVTVEALDGDNWLQFYVDEVGAYKVREQRGGQTRDLIDWTSNSILFSAGTPNRIRINRYADRIEVFANGQGLRTIMTNAFSTAPLVGLGSTSFRGMTASSAFDNFGLHDLSDVPE